MMKRECGGCTLCCRLLPMQSEKHVDIPRAKQKLVESGLVDVATVARMTPDFDKPAGVRCQHQQTGKGCAIYRTRPFGCFFWNCRWLVNDGTGDLRRPDRSHYVIDIMPDYVTWIADDGDEQRIEVVQIWIDPKFPDAHRDPALRAYLFKLAEKNICALIRYDSKVAMTLIGPPMTGDGKWHEVHGQTENREHTHDEITMVVDR